MKSIRIAMIAIISIAAILISIILSLALGARPIPFDEVISTLWSYDWFGSGVGDTSNLNQLVVAERIPRTIFALIAGGALGVAGALMQSLTRNPIADPSILGVNTGASLSVVIGITFFKLVIQASTSGFPLSEQALQLLLSTALDQWAHQGQLQLS